MTPTKGHHKQAHDRRASSLFLAFFDARSDPKRRADRSPESLDRKDWEEFVTERRAAGIARLGPVRDRMIAYDVKFLISVLSPAVGANEGDPHFIGRNPWSRERRRAQGMTMPREKNPRRPTMTEEWHELLLTHSPNWRFALVMELCRETIHRRNSVRQIALADLDLEARTIIWLRVRQERHRDHHAAHEAGEGGDRGGAAGAGVPVADHGGGGPEQPGVDPRAEPLAAAGEGACRTEGEGARFPRAETRERVRRKEFRELPPKVQEALTGTNHETLRKVYEDVSLGEMREAVERLSAPRRRRAGGDQMSLGLTGEK